ncbi:HIRAN domain-containing protein [Negadavirga shengliensis]|uniref:HIRAN domain-containing protein n=1 Tax=Negadavirga shengliensis TaxID=1389218 RepID=A0ABV9SVV5_9BACT
MKIDRKEFLKVIGLGGSSLVLPLAGPGPDLLTGLMAQSVKIYDNYLKGVEYYDLGKCLKQIHVGDDVVLTRFADHRHDRFAIGVTWEKFFLGYLPAYENIVLANLMDAGAVLKAMVTAKQSFHRVGIGVWTDLIVHHPNASKKLSDGAANDVDDWYRR